VGADIANKRGGIVFHGVEARGDTMVASYMLILISQGSWLAALAQQNEVMMEG
jgi:hypothetical protein